MDAFLGEDKSQERRRTMKGFVLNKWAFTELVVSIDISNSSEKIMYGI
jgi:hypothetical protein